MSKKKKKDKNISVSIDPNFQEIRTYDLFLIKKNEIGLEVQLARRNETDDEIEIVIENIFRISDKRMYNFALDTVRALQDSELEKE